MNDYKSKYNFSLERIKAKDELIELLKEQLKQVKNNGVLADVSQQRELLIAEKLQEHFDKYPSEKFEIDCKVLARVVINCG